MHLEASGQHLKGGVRGRRGSVGGGSGVSGARPVYIFVYVYIMINIYKYVYIDIYLYIT